jgi:hypothetical protein
VFFISRTPYASHLKFSCPNARKSDKATRGTWYVKRWTDVYLKTARERLQGQISGFELSIEDAYTMQLMCAYEVCAPRVCVPIYHFLNFIKTVAIGYSKFCELFTVEEWEGFDYA